MITYQVSFNTHAEAEDYAQKVLSAYNPVGYGTHLTIRQDEKGYFVVEGHRANSCD